MMKDVAIVDYGVGNLHSVARAVGVSGSKPVLVSNAESVRSADIIILPGVGAFDRCVALLKQDGLWEALVEVVGRGTPVLGICVGMQMMMSRGREFGETAGFGFIPGIVEAIPDVGSDGTKHKIPHTGWSDLSLTDTGRAHACFRGFSDDRSGYFVHSFAVVPEQEEHVLARTAYNGVDICAAIGRDNIIGFQFHPEKSGPAGLVLLKSFIDFC